MLQVYTAATAAGYGIVGGISLEIYQNPFW